MNTANIINTVITINTINTNGNDDGGDDVHQNIFTLSYCLLHFIYTSSRNSLLTKLKALTKFVRI